MRGDLPLHCYLYCADHCKKLLSINFAAELNFGDGKSAVDKNQAIYDLRFIFISGGCIERETPSS